ncbi:MAG: outer membrane protein assembly factor BamA, partial [Desulfobulbaceae bacterium]|nr:outer membrane protein assembly factor BamA [Desulfobulbaceae bacterium]
MKPIVAWPSNISINKKANSFAPFQSIILLIIFAFILALPATSAQAADNNQPAPLILPFKINAPKAAIADLTSQADNALKKLAADKKFTVTDRSKAMKAFAYETSWPPPIDKLKKFPAARNAEYIIIGTLNQVGNRVSIDLAIFDLLEENPPKYFFNDGELSKGLLPLITKLSDDALAYTGRHFRYADITVTGNKRIDSGAILRKIKSKTGARYDAAQLDEDIRSIFQMGYFNDVQVKRDETDAGIKINFTITEKEVVGSVKIKGEDKIDEDDIKEVITISPNSIINPKEIRASVDNIKKLYKDKGFYRTEVTSELTHPKEDRVDVNFVIKEGFKAYIKDIIISGNNSFSEKEIKKVMMTSERGLFSWFTDAGILKRDMIEQDAARINAFYNNHGYIDVKVGKPDIQQKEKSIFITIPIEEGQRYMVGEIYVSGDLIDEKGELLAKTKIGSERYFNRETLHNDVLALTDYYAENGYAYAEVNPSTKKDLNNQRLGVTFEINKKQLVSINRIVIKGNDRTRDKVIRREMRVKEGEKFNATGIKKSQERLQRLDYFEEATVTPQPTADERVMDVEVAVKEKATGTFSLGAGYSSVDNLMFMGEVSQNNFRGLGQQLS